MTKWWNKGLCVLASAVLALGLFASQVYAATGVPDDDLIAGYIEQRLEAELPKASSTTWGRMNARPTTGLAGNDYAVYTALKPMIAAVAAGERTSTVFEIAVSDLCDQTMWTAAELGVSSIVEGDAISEAAANAAYAKIDFDLRAVFNALMADCPYDLYWFDKTTSFGYESPWISTEWNGSEWVLGFDEGAVITITMPVSANYSASGTVGTYEVNPTTGQRVSTAVETATAIAAGGEELSAYNRLAYFKDQICELTSYNDAAAADDDMPYGDPWQLIYVFDGDESTNVVCEGYSKAFQYLCDLAGIPGVNCITVTGTMIAGPSMEAHMWNLVNMDDGLVYLVDVTNCDEGTAGYPNHLFVAPYSSGSVSGGYGFIVPDGVIRYIYDDDTLTMYSVDELTVSEEEYDSSSTQTSGMWGTCPWELGEDGVLTVYPGEGAGNTGSPHSPWIGLSNRISSIVFAEQDGKKVIAPANSACLFSNLARVETIDVSGLDTSRVTDMANMFRSCPNLAVLDLSTFDTSNVTNMYCMYYGCASLTSLDLASFDTSRVENMCSMFFGCNSLVSLDVSSFDTSHVTDMRSMFYLCYLLAEVDVSGFDTSKVTDMSYMFANCESLRELDVSGFDTSSVSGYGESAMGGGMSMMFYNCIHVTSLDVSGWDTSGVTDMSGMFAGCCSLTELDVSGFDTSNVQGDGSDTAISGMAMMFNGCSSLTSLDVSNFDTSKVQNMTTMFYNCASLTELDVSGFDTSSVTGVHGSPYDTGMYYMFGHCEKLVSLDLSGWDISHVTDLGCMFEGCTSLESLDLSGWNSTVASDMNCMFHYCESLVSLELPDMQAPNVTDLAGMFGHCSSLKSLNLCNFYAPEATNLNAMFSMCTSLEDLNIGGMYVPSVTDMGGMLEWCTALESIDLSEWDTSSVTNMEQLFFNCTALKSLDLSGWDTSQVTSFRGTFLECTALEELNLSGWDTSSATTMENMFRNCAILKSLDVSKLNTSKVTNMEGLFVGCRLLAELDVSGFDTRAVTTMRSMFSGCEALKELNVSSFDTSRVTDMEGMFYDCASLTALDLSNFETSSVKSMVLMFSNCPSLEFLDISGFDTSYTEDMGYMFNYCSSLQTLIVGKDFVMPTDEGKWDEPSGYWRAASDGQIYSGFELVYRGVADTYLRVTDLSGAEVEVADQVYTGSAIEPDVLVTLSGKTLDLARDYDVTYSDNIEVGTATVTITGKGNYTGTATGHFEIEPKPHSYVAVAEVPATCTKAGTAAHYKCSDCGKLFVLEGGNYFETSLDKLTIPALGHDWDEGVVTTAPTCETDGVRTFTCKHDSSHTKTETIPATGHSFKSVAEVPATCTKAGTAAHYKCSECGKLFVLEGGAYVETTADKLAIPALGHTWDEGVVTTAPTCEKDGVRTYTCKNDSSHTKTETIAALGHDWDEGVVTTAPTCETDGVRTFTCKNDACHTKTEAIPATGHSYKSVAEVPATCTKAGTAAHYKCSDCGKLFVLEGGAYIETSLEKLAIPALGHTWDEGVVTKPATETTEGVMTFTCTICGETRTESIPTTDHTYVFVAEVPATCTKAGTAAHYKCDDCGKLFVLEGGNYFETTADKLSIPALGHDWDEGVVTTAPTCEVDGVRTFTCKNDPAHTKTEVIPALGHTYGDWAVTKEATCTEAGSREKVCSACGDKVVEEIAALGHTWATDYTVDKPATCSEEGSESIHCTVCGAQKEGSSRAIPALGHTYGDWAVTKEATCTEAGSREKTCSACGDKVVEEIAALGHDWDEGVVTTAPTCEADGVRTFTCKNDPNHTWTETIPATGHTWDEGVVTTPATTTSEGVMTYTCTTCGETRTEAIPKLTPAHEPGWANENGGWYYYEEDGTLRTGEWIQALGNWYYLGADGKLVINGWSEWQGKYYYMGSNGQVMKEGWAEWQGKYYYVKNYQVMKEGWIQYNGKYFYIRSYTPVVNDWVNYDGKWYHFNASGVCDRVA